MIYKGSCHCGKVAFEAEGEIGEATDPKGNKMAAVNARCLEGVDPDNLVVKKFNGRAL